MKHYITGLFLLLVSTQCSAHVRWFSEEAKFPPQKYEFDLIYMAVTILAIAYCVFCYWLDSLSAKDSRVSYFTSDRISLSGVEWCVLKSSIALMFTLNLVEGIYLAPNLDPDLAGQDSAKIVQILVLVCLAGNNTIFAISIFMCLLFTFWIYGFYLSIDYAFEFIAIALAYVAIDINKLMNASEIKNKYVRINLLHPSRFLRIFIGIQLVVLAIHNKLLDPNLALNFVDMYPYVNFLKYMGFSSFSNIHFVYSAGLAELCFGLLLIFNQSTRFVSLCVLFFFSVTSVVFGLHELIGHIPILAGLAVVFLHAKNNQDLEQFSSLVSNFKKYFYHGRADIKHFN